MGCSAIDTVVITGPYSNLGFTVTNSVLSCTNSVDTAVVTIYGLNGPCTFNWADGRQDTIIASPATHIYMGEGDFNVTVTDANNCVTGFDNYVTSTGINITSQGIGQPNCQQPNAGSIYINVEGNITGPIRYAWNTGDTTFYITNLSAGNYVITVTDSVGCSAEAIFTLTETTSEDGYYVFVAPGQTNCGNNATLVAQVSGGISPFTYFWQNPNMPFQTTETAIGLSPGSYSLMMTDSAGCIATATVNVTANCRNILLGHVFIDYNNNCIIDSGDIPFGSVVVTATNGINTYLGVSDGYGNYYVDIPESGTFNIVGTVQGSQCSGLVACGSSTVTFPSTGDSIFNINFAWQGITGYDLALHPGWEAASPGFQKKYWAYVYSNNGSTYRNHDAVVTLHYDPNLVFQYIGAGPYPTVADTITHTITWSVYDTIGIWPGVYLSAYFFVPYTLDPNYLLQTQYSVTPVNGDCTPFNNSFSLGQSVGSSLDPNEKTVSPAGNITADDSILTYTINFQNTGTASTKFIVITDTLSPWLDATTVVNVASSALYSNFNISGSGILTWTFNPLFLPDSVVDPKGSKGFIMFTVKRKRNQPLGATINNTAYIYFDYNNAVITNTVKDTVAQATGIPATYTSNDVSVKAFPNPFSDATNIIINGINTSYSFELFDLTGRLERSIPDIQSKAILLPRNDLANGVYLYRILIDNNAVAYGKLAVQ